MILNFFDRNNYFKDEIFFRESVEVSLSRLKNCKINCLFLHSPNVNDINLKIIKSELRKLKLKNKIEAFGISLNSPSDLKFFVENKFIPKYIQISAENYLFNKNFYINICKNYNIYIVVNRIFSIPEIKNDNKYMEKLTMDQNIKFVLLGLTQAKYLNTLNAY
jgi:diketogulonate reductase-like aldo/keto reductase